MTMKIISSREVYQCNLFRVTEDKAKDRKSGFEIRRSVVHHGGSAVMMAVDAKKRVLLVRQYRLPAGKDLWELPAGRLDPGEKPLQAAKRELIEETGYRAQTMNPIGEFYSSPGVMTEVMHVFAASGLEPVGQALEPGEKIVPEIVDLECVRGMLSRAELRDGKTIATMGLYFATTQSDFRSGSSSARGLDKNAGSSDY